MLSCVNRLLQVVIVEARRNVSSSGAAHKTALLSGVPSPGSLDVLLWLLICPIVLPLFYLGSVSSGQIKTVPSRPCCKTCSCSFSFACMDLLSGDLEKNRGLHGWLDIRGVTWSLKNFTMPWLAGLCFFLEQTASEGSWSCLLFFTLVLPMMYVEEER